MSNMAAERPGSPEAAERPAARQVAASSSSEQDVDAVTLAACGRGPSSKTCPRWPPQRLHVTSCAPCRRLRSRAARRSRGWPARSRLAPARARLELGVGAEQLGAAPAHRQRAACPSRRTYLPVNGRSVALCRSDLDCSGDSRLPLLVGLGHVVSHRSHQPSAGVRGDLACPSDEAGPVLDRRGAARTASTALHLAVRQGVGRAGPVGGDGEGHADDRRRRRRPAAPPESPGCRSAARMNTSRLVVRAGRRGRGRRADTFWPIAAGATASASCAAGVAEHGAGPHRPVPVADRPAASVAEAGHAQQGEVAVGVEARRPWPASVRAVGLRAPAVCWRSPATTWALVTTRSAATAKPLPSWMRSQASPSTLTVDAGDPVACTASEARARPAAARGPAPGAGRRTPAGRCRRRPGGAGPAGCRAAGGSGRRSHGRWPSCAPAAPASPARRPSTAAAATPRRGRRAAPTPAPTARSTVAERPDRAGPGGGARRASSPSAWPTKRAADQDRRRRAAAGRSGRRRPSASTTPGRKPGGDDQPDGQPDPRRDPGQEAEPVAADAAATAASTTMTRSSRSTCVGRSALGSEQPGGGEEAGVGDHAVVGPHRLALDVPAALQHLDGLGHAEARCRRAPRAAGPPGRWSAGRRRGCRRGAAPSRRA